jgi:hypothetical protein
VEEEFSVSRDNIDKTNSINIKVNDEEYKHYLTTSEIKHSQNFNSYKVTITNIPSNFLFHRNGTLFSIVLILTNNKKFNFEFTLSDFEGLKVIPDSMFTFANIPETNYRILTGFTETAKMPGTLDGYDTFFVPNNVIHIADEAFGNFEIRSGGGDGPLPFVGVYCSKK